MKRVASNVILILGVLYVPWWIVIIAAVLLAFWFRQYVELVIVGLLIDLLYGVSATTLFPYAVTAGTAIAFGVIAFLKTKLRIYE